jgi:alpha-glucosidase (family GH31 glycosyl hydrolase)
MKLSIPSRQSFFICLILGLLLIQSFCSSHISTETPSQNLRGSSATGEPEDNSRMLVDVGDYVLSKNWNENNEYHYQAVYKGGSPAYKNSEIIKNLHMIVTFHDKSTFRIRIIDDDNERWEIPEKFPFPHFTSPDKISQDQGDCIIDVETEPFAFTVTRKDNGQVIFDTKNKKFIYSNLYIELGTSLPTDNVYGFGERNYQFKLGPGRFTIWGRDDPKLMEDGSGGYNTYSHHPVALVKDEKGYFFLTLMRNSNAMDVVIDRSPSVTYKMVGGVIDLVFFIGKEYPEPILQAYHNYLGKFTMMPFWSMGFHQSKWGYQSYQRMETVVKNYVDNKIPMDVIWSDIDYMIDKEIFTVDTNRYPPEKMKNMLTKYNKKWVPIIDPGVKQQYPRGPGRDEGLKRDIFIKNHKGESLVGSVWPGKVYFPDFFNPKTEKYWGDMLDVTYKTIPFSGIWLDMNEVANFVDGEENRWDKNVYDNLPYNPGVYPLRRKTISLDAVHHGGILEYNVHGLYSLLENAATHKYLQTKSKLPFILTRSSSMGLGRFSAHWSGDNGAYWEYLQASIPGNFNFQIYGIPFVGADICGFMDSTNEELCARWTQLGALYPFARNHHELESRDQEPWTFRGTNRGVSVLDTSRIALQLRYSILKWYYSLFIATRGTGSIFKPLFFEFPSEAALYTADGPNEWEFLLGSGVLCTPKVEAGEPHVNAYFPTANWFNLFTGEQIKSSADTNRNLKVSTPFDAPVPMFIRGGHVIHRQKIDNVLSTNDLNDEFEFIVGLEKDDNDDYSAKGSIMGIQTFDDDSIYHRCMEGNCLYDIIVTVPRSDANSATIEINFKRQDHSTNLPLDEFGLYGLRLYGLPVKFMAADERKLTYAFARFTKGATETSGLEQITAIEDGAFAIDFETVLRIEEGDSISLELII